MISANFAVAVITVVLRGLFDRLIVTPPIIKTPVLNTSTGLLLFSGTLVLLYNHLKNGRKIHMSYTAPMRRKILDGRLHKEGSQSSSRSNIADWSRRRFRSGTRPRANLLEAAKSSLEMLPHQCSSSCSLSSSKCHCEDCATTKENSPSVCSVKTDEPHQGFGDWEDGPKPSKRRKKFRSTRKTRSGKIYSSYL